MTHREQTHELVRELIKTLRTFRQTVQRTLRAHGVEMSFEMLQVMVRLWQQQGVSQQRLGEQTAKDKASLTSLIDNLAKKGWVTRRRDDADGRNRLIYLTPAGETLCGTVRPILDGIYEQAGDRMCASQLQSCRKCLEKLNGIFNEL